FYRGCLFKWGIRSFSSTTCNARRLGSDHIPRHYGLYFSVRQLYMVVTVSSHYGSQYTRLHKPYCRVSIGTLFYRSPSNFITDHRTSRCIGQRLAHELESVQKQQESQTL